MLAYVVSALLFAPTVELASRLADVWDVQTIFPRPFGEIPLENILFAFINFFWVLSFYEYFVDKDITSVISKRFKYLIGLYCLALVVVHLFVFPRIGENFDFNQHLILLGNT